ncbi:MAG TPA: hypothetical protein VFV38_25665 [Ktedonobacteraceae bacterium]|nr:hypothetical protein [Ktedonobacteraceae bacterium]
MEQDEFASGVALHPETGLYQLWLSTNGFDVIMLNAKRDYRCAQADQYALQQVLGAGPYQEERVAAFLARLTEEPDEAPRMFPDEVVRQIC